MRWVFAVALIVGMLALIGWTVMQGNRNGGADQRRGARAQRALAAAVAFGMGGLSASYAGWSLWLATPAALAAAGLAAWYAGTVAGAGDEGRD
jgi:hypothetical protein